MNDGDDDPKLRFPDTSAPLMRRVAGYHDQRFDGVSDVIPRARGRTVLDIGCNRGLAGFELAANGARRVYGIDNYADGIIACRHLFQDLRSVDSRFEVVDLTGGPEAVAKAFDDDKLKHDIVLLFATYHKLARIMTPDALSKLVRYFGRATNRYFVWRGYEAELPALDADLSACGLKRIHTSFISDIQPAAIWARQG